MENKVMETYTAYAAYQAKPDPNILWLGYQPYMLHNWLLASFKQAAQMTSHTIKVETPADLKKLSPYQYKSMLAKNVFLIIECSANGIYPKLIETIDKLNFRFYRVAILFTREWDLEFFTKRFKLHYNETAGTKPIQVHSMPYAKDYLTYLAEINAFMQLQHYQFASKSLQKTLVTRMANRLQYWSTIKHTLDAYQQAGKVFEEDNLDDIFVDMLRFTYADLFEALIRNNGVRKRYEMLDYFLNTRGYPPKVVMNDIIRKFTIKLGMYYIAYTNGVLTHPLPKDELGERLTFVDWQAAMDKDVGLSKDAYRTQKYFLEIIQDIDYQYFLDFSKIVFAQDYLDYPTRASVYSLCVELAACANKYNNGKPFVNKRMMHHRNSYTPKKAKTAK